MTSLLDRALNRNDAMLERLASRDDERAPFILNARSTSCV